MNTGFIFFGKKLPTPKITQVHLSLMRIFQFNLERKRLKKEYDFLADQKKYYEKVLYDGKFLGKQNLIIPNVGKLRSCTDFKDKDLQVDRFLSNLQHYYSQLAKRHKLFLMPHYPCVIDILASKNDYYQIEKTKLPGSLSSCSEPKLSIALRIYPAGMVSVRLGLYLQTATSFEIRDIIDFLWNKNAVVNIRNQSYNIDKLTKEFVLRLSAGIFKDQQTTPALQHTFSMVTISEADPYLTFQNNKSDMFLPLLCLNMQPDRNIPVTGNLSRKPEVFMVGGKGNTVFFIPDDKKYVDEHICDRHKLRCWTRNVFELYALQNFLRASIVVECVGTDFQIKLSTQNWIKKLKKGILPPALDSLFSNWNYVQIHQQDYPLKEGWKKRYVEILKVLDPGDAIKNSKIQARTLLDKTIQQAAQDSKDASSWLQKLIEIPEKIKIF
jgi:hypothetical protein